MLGMINRGRITDLAVVQEFEHLIGRLRGFLSQSFDEDGQLVIADPNLAVVPLGGLIPYAGTAAPTGWLLCDGSQVSRVTYQSLFELIGTTYGAGDGSTTFNVPDLQQRFPLGKAAAGTGALLGATGGAIDHTHTGGSHSHTISSGGSHSHTVNAHNHSIPSGGSHVHALGNLKGTATSTAGSAECQSGTGFNAAVGGHAHFTVNPGGSTPDTDSGGSHDHGGSTGNQNPGTDSQGSHDHGGSTGSANAGTTSSSNPPFLAVNYIIFTGV